jgi:alkylhydroperoxidase/carboxymuconolactone decarboxylase family protein YurZ
MIMKENPYEVFRQECPEPAGAFNEAVKVRITLPEPGMKTRQPVTIAIRTANRNPPGVKMHTIIAFRSGADRDEVVGAVVMNFHLSGLSPVVGCPPAAPEGWEYRKRMPLNTAIP